MSFTLGDVVSGLSAKGGGRQNWGVTTDGSIGIVAAQQAIAEITETAELEELKYVTPIPPATPLSMTYATPVIPISAILNTISSNTSFPQFQSYASLFTSAGIINDVYTFWIWFQGGINMSGRTLKYRRIPTVDMNAFGITASTQQSYGVAPPVYYSRFNQYLQVGPSPDQNYLYFVRVKLPQVFPATSLADQPIFAPDSWMDVFQYAAIVRLGQDEGIQDSSIYKTASDFLEKRGMAPWQLRTLQMQRDERHNERSLSLRTAVYTWANR